MSDTGQPIYVIRIKHDAWTGTTLKYDWAVHRISDDARMASGWGHDEDEAIAAAQDAITRAKDDEGTQTLYADEDGELVDPPVPQSLRA